MSSQSVAQLPTHIDAHLFHLGLLRFIGHVQTHEALINDLNVFPVPDGDTGTNSLLTIAHLAARKSWPEHSLRTFTHSVALACADQARGNSGVILAEYFRGMAAVATQSATSHEWRSVLQSAAQTARRCVADPREGTILSVADAVAAVIPTDDLADYLARLALTARQSVQATTDQLEELQAAGVVDAGAFVLSLFHDAMVEQVTGLEMPPLPVVHQACAVDQAHYSGPEFELMFMIDMAPSDLDRIRDYLVSVGDSVTTAGAHSPFHIHAHVNHPHDVVDHVMTFGRAFRISLSSLTHTNSQRHESELLVDETRAVVICHGAHMATELRTNGVTPVQVMPRSKPSTRDIRDAIVDTRAQRVVVFPSDPDCVATARMASQEARALGLEVDVVPTNSIVQSLAALSVLDGEATVDEQREYLCDVVDGIAYGAVTFAERDATTPVGDCHVGDVLGLVNGRVAFVSGPTDVESAGHHVINELLKLRPLAETFTVVIGAQGSSHFVDVVRSAYPDIEVTSLQGGQLLWPYLIGVE